MGSGSAARQRERRFGQGEPAYDEEFPAPKERCKEHGAKAIRIFWEYGVRKTEKEEYELLKNSEPIGCFSKAVAEDDRFLFLLNHGVLLEVSEKGCREVLIPEKAEICGLIASDGGLYSTKEHPDFEVHFISKDKKLIERYCDLFKKVYNIEPYVYHKRKRDGREYFEARTYDKKVFFDLLDLRVKPGTFKFHVPLEHLDKDGLRAYLRGFFSGDGDITRDGRSLRVRMSSTCKEGIEKLWEALSLLGFHPTTILVSKREPPWHDCYYFYLPVDECARFAEEIGTYHPGRAEKLLESIRLKHEENEKEGRRTDEAVIEG